MLRAMQRGVLSVAALLLAAAPLGCGGVYYGVTASAAQARLEQARALGAETRAPYEYHFAKAHLEQASVEASEASYSDAADYAEVAEQYAIKAAEIAKVVARSEPEAAKGDGEPAETAK